MRERLSVISRLQILKDAMKGERIHNRHLDNHIALITGMRKYNAVVLAPGILQNRNGDRKGE